MSSLRSIFRSSQDRVWEQVAQELGARFHPATPFGRNAAFTAFHEDWFINFDLIGNPKSGYKTRIRAPYLNADSFQFRVFRRAGLNISWIPGVQDIEIGDAVFDKEYLIQSNDPIKVKELFAPQKIRELIAWQANIELRNNVDDTWVSHPFHEGLSELYLEIPGIVKNPDQLKDIYELFAAILNHLCHLGSAYEDDPLIFGKS